jgi:hypothetical protein
VCVAAALWCLPGCSIPSAADDLPFFTRPHITAVSPARTPIAGASLPVIVTGSNFLRGLSLFVTLPDASIVNLAGDALDDLRLQSFDVTIPRMAPARTTSSCATRTTCRRRRFSTVMPPPS